MKLYIVTGRINERTGFGLDKVTGATLEMGTGTAWNITAYTDVISAQSLHDSLRHGTAKLCKVVEIEIPDE